MEDYPSDLRISNKNKSRFLGKKFLEFDFNFTKITDIENKIDSIPNNEKMKYLRDKYLAQNKQDLSNNKCNKNLNDNETSPNNNNKNIVINLDKNQITNDENKNTKIKIRILKIQIQIKKNSINKIFKNLTIIMSIMKI